jgi:hypothetical protein
VLLNISQTAADDFDGRSAGEGTHVLLVNACACTAFSQLV